MRVAPGIASVTPVSLPYTRAAAGNLASFETAYINYGALEPFLLRKKYGRILLVSFIFDRLGYAIKNCRAENIEIFSVVFWEFKNRTLLDGRCACSIVLYAHP